MESSLSWFTSTGERRLQRDASARRAPGDSAATHHLPSSVVLRRASGKRGRCIAPPRVRARGGAYFWHGRCAGHGCCAARNPSSTSASPGTWTAVPLWRNCPGDCRRSQTLRLQFAAKKLANSGCFVVETVKTDRGLPNPPSSSPGLPRQPGRAARQAAGSLPELAPATIARRRTDVRRFSVAI